MNQTTTNLNDYEVRESREVYGNDERAINRHSVRCYKLPGYDPLIYINKTLDGCPPFYEVYTCELVGFATPILIAGERYFGDGLTWDKAIAKATPDILEYIL